MKNHFILFIGFTLTILISCQSFFKITVEIDNPTESVLMVSVDDNNYELAPNSTEAVQLVKGEHTILAKLNGKETYDGVISITNDGLLNLCNSTYVIHKEIYLADQSMYAEHADKALNLMDVEINDKTYQNVDFKVFREQLFVANNWDYGLDQELPEEINATDGEYAVISKLYRIDALEKDWGFYGDFDFTGNSDEELQMFLDSLNNHVELLQDTIGN